MKTHQLYNDLRRTLLNEQVLPEMQQATLKVVESDYLNIEQLNQKLHEANLHDGWAVYTDRYQHGSPSVDCTGLLEGEWFDGAKTTTVAYLGEQGYRYLVVEQVEGDTHIVHQQVVLTRHNKACIYNIWWNADTSGEQQGLVKPIFQQYLGSN